MSLVLTRRRVPRKGEHQFLIHLLPMFILPIFALVITITGTSRVHNFMFF